MYRSLFSILVVLAVVAPSFAQRAPMKWGDVPEDQLLMTTFAADTNAAAVVLGAFGNTYFTDGFVQVFEYHVRVKLLRESSYEEFGTVKIPYLAGRDAAKIRDLKAQTITMGSNGKPVVHKVDRASIFKNKVGRDLEVLTFTFPALQTGAVVEYHYKVEKPQYYVNIEPWRFQASEPMLHSEYRIEFPSMLQYMLSSVGETLSKLSVNENDLSTKSTGTYVRYRWVMENVPALREEPFMTAAQDFRMAIRFQWSGMSEAGWGMQQRNNTWGKAAESILANDGPLGEHLNRPGRDVRAAAEEAVGDVTDPAEKMKRIYDYVRTRIDFNGESGAYVDRTPKDVLKDRTGGSPEINLLLVAMLREAGLTAHPVLLSTRDNGLPNTVYPMLSQFNDLIAAAEIGSERYLLDATDEMRPYDLLPYNSLNGEAWMVRHPQPAWIPVAASASLTQQRLVTMDVHEDGRVTGHASAANTGYAALFSRHELADTDDDVAYVREKSLTT